VLHTWSQKLTLHPHVHCVIPAGGLSPDLTHWVHSQNRFFPQGALESLSRQVRRWSQAGAPNWSAELPWKPRSTRPAETFRCVATIAIPQGLGGLRQTPLGRS
jgi:hypothetical protein